MKVHHLNEGIRYGSREKELIKSNLDMCSLSFSLKLESNGELSEDIASINIQNMEVDELSDNITTVSLKKSVSGEKILSTITGLFNAIDTLASNGYQPIKQNALSMVISYKADSPLNVSKFIALSELYKFKDSGNKLSPYNYIIEHIDDVIRQFILKNLNSTDKSVGEIIHDFVVEGLSKVKNTTVRGAYQGLNFLSSVSDSNKIEVVFKDGDIMYGPATSVQEVILRSLYTMLVSHNSEIDNEFKKTTVKKIDKAFQYVLGIDVNAAMSNAKSSIAMMGELNFRSPYDVAEKLEMIMDEFHDQKTLFTTVIDMIEDNKNRATVTNEYHAVLVLLHKNNRGF